MAMAFGARRLCYGLIGGLFLAAAASGQTLVGGSITSDTTWTLANSPYEMVSTVVVNNGATLTVEPGVIVRGNSNTTLQVNVGHLSAIGSPGSPILLTSVLGTGPEQWDGVYVGGGSATAEMRHCEVRFAGQPNALAVGSGIAVSGSPMVTIANCTVRDCSGSPAVSSAIYLSGNATVEITDSLFENCGDQLSDFAVRDQGITSLTLSGSLFSSNAGRAGLVSAKNVSGVIMNTFSANGVDRVRVLAGTTADGGVMRAQASGFQGFELSAGDILVPTGTLFTIEAGVNIFGISNAAELQVQGRLECLGTEPNPIVMTSLDDSDATLWDGLTFNGAGATGLIQWTSIRRGGGGNAFAVNANVAASNTGLVRFENCWFSDIATGSTDYGFYGSNAIIEIVDSSFISCGDATTDFAFHAAANNGNTVIENCLFSNNIAQCARVQPGSVQGISGCVFSGNSVPRIRVNAGATTVGAMMEDMAGLDSWEIHSGDVLVPAGTTLTVGPGAWIRGLNNTSELQVQGRLECLGTLADPIVMTSYDDTESTRWDGVTFNGANSSGLLQWTNIRRGGGGNAFAIRSNLSAANSPDVVLEDCEISDISVSGNDYGIYNTNSGVFCVRTTFRNCGPENGDFGYYAASASGSVGLEDCVFLDNIGQCARVQPGSLQNITGGSFSNNTFGRIRIAAGNTASAGAMEHIPGMDGWEIDTGDVLVPSGTVLTIGPGVRLFGLADTSELQVQGRLECLGTASDPIVMTSFDDTDATIWDGLTFNGANASGLLRWTEIRRGGGSNAFAIRSNVTAANSPDIVMEDCTVSDIDSGGTDYGIYSTNSVIECLRTTFRNCGDSDSDFGFFAFSAAGSSALVDGSFENNLGVCALVQANSIQDVNGCSFSANASDRIRVRAGSTAVASAMVVMDGMEGWEIGTGDIVVPSSGTLVISPGVTVFGLNDGSELQVQGRLECLGTMAEPILMTSVHDSNADTWDGITFNGANSSGLLQWTTVRYGGGGNGFAVRSNISTANCPDLVMEHCDLTDIEIGGNVCGLYCSNSNTRVSECEFARIGAAETGSAGMYIVSGSVRVEHCVFDSNDSNGMLATSGSVSLSCSSFTGNAVGLSRTSASVFASECSFEGNTEFGVRNTGGTQLNVCCSWWGDASGPEAPGGSGAGDAITDNVGYIPFSVTDDACGFDCLAGDANNDGNVNLADLNLVLANFGGAVEIGTDGDVNDDGVVNLADLNLVLANFGEACEASA
ncbi:MAG: right-handed parallel beta-helix repeat-containing protein [Phycisphaerales bacterium JB065]